MLIYVLCMLSIVILPYPVHTHTHTHTQDWHLAGCGFPSLCVLCCDCWVVLLPCCHGNYTDPLQTSQHQSECTYIRCFYLAWIPISRLRIHKLLKDSLEPVVPSKGHESKRCRNELGLVKHLYLTQTHHTPLIYVCDPWRTNSGLSQFLRERFSAVIVTRTWSTPSAELQQQSHHSPVFP